MYLFNFSKFAGNDKIFILNTKDDFVKKIKAGDRIRYDKDYFLVIGKEISRQETFKYFYSPMSKGEIIYKSLLSNKSIDLLNRMVYNYYTSYKSVVKYFLSNETYKLIQKEQKKGSKTIIESNIIIGTNGAIDLSKGQNLIIFPDLWNIYNTIDNKILESENIAFLRSTDTQNQKDKLRWNIKKGYKNIIISTHSEIFQDYYDLKKIIIVDPNKWYYANQQDPRYKTIEVAKKISEIYNAEFVEIGI